MAKNNKNFLSQSISPSDNNESSDGGNIVEKMANLSLGRRPYQAATLLEYGDVRDITMGPTVGFGESGGGPQCALGVNCPP